MGSTVPDVRPIDPEEGRLRIEEFRSSRGGMDSILSGELIHSPRRGKTTNYPVRICTGWENQRILLRIQLNHGLDNKEIRQILLTGGGTPMGWIGSADEEEPPIPISLPDFLQPLLPEIELTPFDLLAPYVDWPDFRYVGSERVAGSPSHWFEFEPPSEWKIILEEEGIYSVKVALDTRFDAPVRVEYMDSNGNVVRTLNVRSFKRIDGVWLVRRIEALHGGSRDRTELRIRAASVNMKLPVRIWNAMSLMVPLEQDISFSDLTPL